MLKPKPETMPKPKANRVSIGQFMTLIIEYMIKAYGLHTFHDDIHENSYVLYYENGRFVVLTEYKVCRTIPLVLIENDIDDAVIADYRHKIAKSFIPMVQTYNIMPPYGNMSPVIRMKSSEWINHDVPYVVLRYDREIETHERFIFEIDPSRHIVYVIPSVSEMLSMKDYIHNRDLLQLMLIDVERVLFYEADKFFTGCRFGESIRQYYPRYISQYYEGEYGSYSKIHNVVSDIIHDYMYLFCSITSQVSSIVCEYLGSHNIVGIPDNDYCITGIMLGIDMDEDDTNGDSDGEYHEYLEDYMTRNKAS